MKENNWRNGLENLDNEGKKCLDEILQVASKIRDLNKEIELLIEEGKKKISTSFHIVKEELNTIDQLGFDSPKEIEENLERFINNFRNLNKIGSELRIKEKLYIENPPRNEERSDLIAIFNKKLLLLKSHCNNVKIEKIPSQILNSWEYHPDYDGKTILFFFFKERIKRKKLKRNKARIQIKSFF